MGSQRVGHDWTTSLSLFTFTHWRRKWQPTPVFLPGESQGRWSLVGLPSMGSYRVGHNWRDLAAAAAVVVVIMEWAYYVVGPMSSAFNALDHLIFTPTLWDVTHNSTFHWGTWSLGDLSSWTKPTQLIPCSTRPWTQAISIKTPDMLLLTTILYCLPHVAELKIFSSEVTPVSLPPLHWGLA